MHEGRGWKRYSRQDTATNNGLLRCASRKAYQTNQYEHAWSNGTKQLTT